MDDKAKNYSSTNSTNKEANAKKTENQSYDMLPYPDPAISNPVELATFPKAAPKVDAAEITTENTTHLVNKERSSVREGRNIISTDNNPDRDGFM